MRYLLLMALATVLVFGGCSDSDSDCNLGDLDWDSVTVFTPVGLEGLAGYTSISGDLNIECPLCTNLSDLICLTSVGGGLYIESNATLESLDGLSALTSVGNEFWICNNDILPDCEVCDLLDQFTSGPPYVDVNNNFDDSCTPVPAGCP